MSKKMCNEEDGLDVKIRDKKKKYLCEKCGRQSPKEKWCCKPKKIKQ